MATMKSKEYLTLKDIKLPIVYRLSNEEFNGNIFIKNNYLIKICDIILSNKEEPAYKKLKKCKEKLSEEEKILLSHSLKVKLNENIPKEIYSLINARVYFFVSKIGNEEVIKKIGGSLDKSGILGTLNFYLGGMSGSPGRPRFIINALIKKELLKGRNIELFSIFLPIKEIKVFTPFFKEEKVIKISSYKEYEKMCLDEYRMIVGKYPEWNFQENKVDYPKELEELFNKYHRCRIKDYII
ncbi:MAG: hypothetical protein ABGW69_00180 [Nanoarchaeota archaeon]